MRIVGGSLGGRVIASPHVSGVRPTSERVREALASALDARGRIEDARVLELFAGTGAVGLELISRGARSVLFVERERRLLGALGASAKALGVAERVATLSLDLEARPTELAERLRAHAPFDLVFADPPYAAIAHVVPLLDALREAQVIDDATLIVVEHATKLAPRTHDGLATISSYRYGDTTLTWLAYGDQASAG